MSDSADVDELEVLCGPPPVLSTESPELYETIAAGLFAAHKPRDVMEKLLVRQMADAAFEMLRYLRHKNWTIDRRYREYLNYQAQHAKALVDGREGLDQNQLPTGGSEIDRLIGLLQVYEGGGKNMREATDRTARDLDHARGLEDGMDHYERIDRLHDGSFKRFREAFVLLQQYSEARRWQQRSRSADIVDAEFQEA